MAPIHHTSENIKNTSLFHPPGLQMQFYHQPRGAPPTPPTLPAGPLKSSKPQGRLRFFNICAYVGRCWRIFDHLGVMLGSSWLQLGPLGPIMALSWAISRSLGAHLGSFWALLAATNHAKPAGKTMFCDITLKINKTDACFTILRPCCGHVGPSEVPS